MLRRIFPNARHRLLPVIIILLGAGWIAAGLYLWVGRDGGRPTNIAVWIATRDVTGGVVVDATAVREQDEPADLGVVGLRAASPVGQSLVFAHGLKAGDMLRDDDV